MKRNFLLTCLVIGVILLAMSSPEPAMAAFNEAVDSGSTITLTGSGQVEVTVANTPKLVKQIYDMSGTCLASSDTSGGADSCGTPSTATIAVPSGTQLQFLIYIRNESDVQLSDVRFVDNIDDLVDADGAFVYAGPDLVKTTPIGSLPAFDALASAIYTSASDLSATGQSDISDTGTEDYVTLVNEGDGGLPNLDYMTVGDVGGVSQNLKLNIPARKTFGVLIPVTKQ